MEHSVTPCCVYPLTVAEGKKLRLVIDLRHVNKYLVKFRFKYEDLLSLSQVHEEGHWFFTWDLKSCSHHHVDICPNHQMFLGFSWSIRQSKVCPSILLSRYYLLALAVLVTV